MSGGICQLPLIVLDILVKSLLLGSDTNQIVSNDVDDVIIHNHVVNRCRKPQKGGACCNKPVNNKCTRCSVIFTSDKLIGFQYFDKVEIVNTVIQSSGFYSYVVYVLYNLATVKQKFAVEWDLPTDLWENIILQHAHSALFNDIVKISHDKIVYLNSIYGCLICNRKNSPPCICTEENKPKMEGCFNNVILYWLPLLISLDCIFSSTWFSITDTFKMCLHDTLFFYVIILVNKAKDGMYTVTIKCRYKCNDHRKYRRLLYRTYKIRHSDTFMYYLHNYQAKLFLLDSITESSLFVKLLKKEVCVRGRVLKQKQSTQMLKNRSKKYFKEISILRNMPACYSLIREHVVSIT